MYVIVAQRLNTIVNVLFCRKRACINADGVRGPEHYNHDYAVRISRTVPQTIDFNGQQLNAFPLFLGVYTDKTSVFQKTVDVCRIINLSLPFHLHRQHHNIHTLGILPSFKLPSSNCGTMQFNQYQREIKYQMCQIFYGVFIALFENAAKNGIIVSGFNSHGVSEKMVAFPRLLCYDGDNESHWEMSGAKQCWNCNVTHDNLDNYQVACGQGECKPLCSLEFNKLRHEALRLVGSGSSYFHLV